MQLTNEKHHFKLLRVIALSCHIELLDFPLETEKSASSKGATILDGSFYFFDTMMRFPVNFFTRLPIGAVSDLQEKKQVDW